MPTAYSRADIDISSMSAISSILYCGFQHKDAQHLRDDQLQNAMLMTTFSTPSTIESLLLIVILVKISIPRLARAHKPLRRFKTCHDDFRLPQPGRARAPILKAFRCSTMNRARHMKMSRHLLPIAARVVAEPPPASAAIFIRSFLAAGGSGRAGLRRLAPLAAHYGLHCTAAAA